IRSHAYAFFFSNNNSRHHLINRIIPSPPFHVPPTPGSSTLSLHDALPISRGRRLLRDRALPEGGRGAEGRQSARQAERRDPFGRSEEHTSELQSREKLVCRLLLEKKKNQAIFCLTLSAEFVTANYGQDLAS